MLAARCFQIQPSPTVELSAHIAELRAEGVDIISFNIGEPDFSTPQYVKEAAFDAINKNFTKYPPANGYPDLRKAIAQKLKRDNNVTYDPSEIVVTNGAKQAVMNALLAVCDVGDEVIVPVPCWVSYTEMVKLAGGTPVLVEVDEKNGYALDIDAIKRAITPKTKAIVINTPNNPTGAVYSEDSLRKLAKLAISNEFVIISDEIYEKMVYGSKKHFSVASVEGARDFCVTINGFSKAYAMPGWRLGYSAAPMSITKPMKAFQSQMTSGACSISQKAGCAALLGPQDELYSMVAAYDKRRQALLKRLNEIPGVKCSDVEGAFYFFPDVTALFGRKYDGKEIKNSLDLANFLLSVAHIAVVPGEAFNGPGKLRLSYANSLENLMEGMDRFAMAVKKLD